MGRLSELDAVERAVIEPTRLVIDDPEEQVPPGGRCPGFGATEGACGNPAGCGHTPIWCRECNAARMAHITRRLEEAQANFGGRRL